MLSVIGIGPGSQAMMTMEAIEALQAAEIVVGYKTYTHLVKAFTGDKQVIKTGICRGSPYSGDDRQYRSRLAAGCAADARLLSYQPQRPADPVAGN